VNDQTEQIDKVIQMLEGKHLSRDSKPYAAALEWLAYLQKTADASRHRRLLEVISATFSVDTSEILGQLVGFTPHSESANGAGSEAALRARLSKGGWLEWYSQYTAKTESPLSYHVFCSLCILGAACGRRLWKPKGFFNIYPNYCVLLIGPPARVAKTSAIEVAKGFIENACLCPIMADKPTPEAICQAVKETGGHQFVFAPEASVFFGRQKYNEGLTTLMLRLLDSPAKFEIRTMGRGSEIVENIAFTVLGGSTLSLLATATPDAVTSSGFLSRFVIVVENDSEREFDEPAKGEKALEGKLYETIERMKSFSGEVDYTPAAQTWFKEWYHARKQKTREIESDAMAESLSRFTVHLERTAILIHLAEHDDMHVCEQCFSVADGLLDYVERRLPSAIIAVDRMGRTQDVDFIFEKLKKLGGLADHSTLLRRVSSRMGATQFRAHIQTLQEQGSIRVVQKGPATVYVIEGGTLAQSK